MKNKVITVTTLLLIISIGNYFRIVSDGNIRTVEFVSIFVIGAFSGVLFTLILKTRKDKNKTT